MSDLLDSRITSILVKFREDWKSCREVWQDQVAVKFEEEFVNPWFKNMDLFLRELGIIEAEILQAKSLKDQIEKF